ncbi:hypothetical protein ACH4F6_12705 [Streptomyces sp. NPDC017936]|uniref:hypothetical protein n=1 Tax=Streptomyces sp. NPDC017936 TaxID=3365016 RepID=UPI0037BC56B1
MTQSGQGEEPSARPAREGIVLPSDGGEPLLPGTTHNAYGGGPQYGQQDPSAAAPTGGQTWGGPWGPEQQQPAGQGWPPPADQQWDAQRQTAPDAWGGPSGPAAPLPPEGAPAPSYGYGVPSAPLPPADEGATQYIPPVPSAPVDEGATQYLPPVAAAAPVDEGATQYLPPVAPGALPPETPSESTHFLGHAPRNGPEPMPGAGPVPGAGAPPGAPHPDAEATQYIPPVTGQAPYGGGGADRQPPAEFENLFRGGPGDDGPAASTAQMPRFSEPEAPGGHGGHGGHGAGHGYSADRPSYSPPGTGAGRRGVRDDDHGGGRGGRTGSRLPLFAAVGVAIAVVGIGAGALLAGGGGGDEGDDGKTVAASVPAGEQSASASADPAEQQAAALDELLADSGSSRATVISAVADVKACTDLAQAASDLRDAAKQRNELVTKLSGLGVDKLPNHTELTTALTKAWQASASADDHYAAWADQVAGNKKQNCKKGTARTTQETQAGNRASGTASTQKSKAAKVWNEIAKKYGLTERQPTQL